MLTRKTLKEIESRPKGAGAAPLLAVGVALVSLGTFAFSLTAALIILAAGAVLCLMVYVKRLKNRKVPVHYALEEQEAARFAEMGQAFDALAASERIWLTGDGPEKLREAATPVEVTRQNPPDIRTNVEVWALNLSGCRLFFMPDTVLLREEDDYRAISYASLDVAFVPEYRREEGEVPSDAEVTGQTWQHVREDGKPDHRFPRNPRLTEVMYGLLEISGPNLKVRLRVSSRNAAMRFTRVLGTKRNDPSGQDRTEIRGVNGERNPSTAEQEMRVELAYGILGLEAGSPQDQVSTAYRKLAKIHHPDRLQDLEPEARELAEARMRTINDAYTNLKRLAK